MKTPETPQPPNTDHDVRVYGLITDGRTIFEGPNVWRVVCSCGGVSDATTDEQVAINSAFKHLDFQLEDHR